MAEKATATIEVFAYPACPGAAPAEEDWLLEDASPQSETGAATQAVPQKRREEDAQQSFAAGRECGREEGRALEREAQAGARQAEERQRRQQLAKAAENIAEERNRALHEAEQEVVKLALAVAARILRREAQMDPLLLTGAVRVALGQITATSEVRLLVPAAELSLWTETVAHLPNLAMRPLVLAGEGMHTGDCMVESSVGSVDLGIRSQLGEIERGFFDRAAAPGKAGAAEEEEENAA